MKTIWKELVSKAEKPLLVVASLASILSLIFLILGENVSRIIALVFICLALFTLVFALIRILNRLVQFESAGDYRKVSSFIIYEFDKSQNLVFETYRLIQVKTPTLSVFNYGFHWTGNEPIEIGSDLQDCNPNPSPGNDKGTYSNASLRLRSPKYFNDTCVIHFRVKTKDPIYGSGSFVDAKVDSPIEIIHFRVILKDHEYKGKASILRKRIETDGPVNDDYMPYEIATSNNKKIPVEVSFDKDTHTYEYYLINPPIGYYYRLAWEWEGKN